MASENQHGSTEPLTPLEIHIVQLLQELSAAIGMLCEEDSDEEEFPLAEFDQRLLFEHVQVIERYVLAQAAARLAPERFRLIGRSQPGADRTRSDESVESDGHTHSDGHERVDDHGHPHEHGDEIHLHHVADPEAARDAHRQGRAIIGEHPWEHGHEEGHAHPDEWAWEPFEERS